MEQAGIGETGNFLRTPTYTMTPPNFAQEAKYLNRHWLRTIISAKGR